MDINLTRPIFEALQLRGRVQDMGGAGLQNYAVYGEQKPAIAEYYKASGSVAAAGKKKAKAKPRKKKEIEIADVEIEAEAAGKGKKGGKKRAKRKAGAKPSAWIQHVQKYAKDHNIKYGQALKEASKSYKK